MLVFIPSLVIGGKSEWLTVIGQTDRRRAGDTRRGQEKLAVKRNDP